MHFSLKSSFKMSLLSRLLCTGGILWGGYHAMIYADRWWDANSLEEEALVLASELLSFQQEALKSQKNLFLTVATGQHWCLGVDDIAPHCQCGLPGDCKVNDLERTSLSRRGVRSHLVFEQDGIWNGSETVYTTLGAQAGETDRLQMSLESVYNSIQIQVHPRDGVSLCSPTLKGLPHCN